MSRKTGFTRVDNPSDVDEGVLGLRAVFGPVEAFVQRFSNELCYRDIAPSLSPFQTAGEFLRQRDLVLHTHCLIDKAFPHGETDQFSSGMEVQLFHDSAAVGIDRIDTEI